MIDFHNQLSIIPQVYETATLQDNLEHSGGIDISWNAAENTEIPVGSYITYGGLHYILLEPYRPTKASAVHYKYSPHFKHPQNMLDRIPFWIKSRTAEGQEINLRTVSFTGYPHTLADKIVQFFKEYADETGDTYFRTVIGTNWTHNLQSKEGQAALNVSNLPVVTVNFDGSSIKSAVNALADAIGCNVFFDWNLDENQKKTIRFIAGTTIDGETYNCFHVLGGTRNMGKVATSGGYAAVTQRLTLEETKYPGSIIDIRPGSSGIRLMQDLILDEVYPKMELYINPQDGLSPRPRNCYLTDEEGNRIEVVVPQGTTPPADAILDPTDGKYYKFYTKWYIHLSYDAEGNNPYVFDREKLINDKPLTILFQPVYDDDNSHPLIGREFELTYFPTNATESERTEWTEDDVLPRTNPFVADPDSYRIIFKAEGETILPTTEGLGLIPKGGDLVTLVNMALSNEEIERAQEELETAALEIIKLYEQRKPDYTKTLIANAIPASASEAIPAIGQEKTLDGVTGIVTSINRNLDTDVADVTIGSWSRKTLTGGVHDKIDTVSVNGGKATESTEDKSSSFSDFETLMRTAPKPNIEKILTPMNQRMDEISQQADRAFNIWFGNGVPDDDGYPASQWTTDEEKELHLHDIYYNTAWNGSVSNGGYFYRYQKDENNEYGWEVVTDLATIAAMSQATTALGTANTAQTTAERKTKVFVGSTIPEPPYNVGDMWWKTDSNGVSGTMYRCTTAKVEGNSPAMSDWTATVIPTESITNALLEFAVAFEGNGGNNLLNYVSNYITVWFRSSADDSVGSNLDLLVTSSNVYMKSGGTWNIWEHESSVLSVLKRINVLRSGVFTEFRIWKGMNISQAQYKLFDLYYVRSSFTDHFLNQNIQGGLGVWVYGTQGWELLQDNTTSLQQNYGDLMRNVIFGSGATENASGIVTTKNFTEIFATAQIPQGGNLAIAAVRTLIETDSQTGLPTGRVLISADRVDFDSSYVNIKGNLHASDDDIFIGKYSDNPNIDDVVIRFRRGASGVFPGIEYVKLSGKDEITADFGFTRTGRIEVRGYKTGNDGNRNYCTDINKGIVFSNGFAALDIDEYAYYGVGTADSPETFNAIGKKITVRGGIITSIANGGATLPTKLSDLTDDLGSSPTHTHSQYLTSLGNRPKIGNLSSSGVTWLTADNALLLPLTNAGAGNYQLVLPTKLSDLTDDLGSSPTHTHSQYLTSLPSHNHDTRYYISNGTIHLGSNSITPITSSNIGSQSVASSKHVKPYATITNKGIGKTVAWVKNWIAEQFENVEDGVGANVSVSFDALNYWNTTNHVVTDANMYTFIKLSGYYSGATYGQWLLSSFDDCEVGIVGRNGSAWGNIHWLATKDWVTDNFQAKASDIRKKNLDGDVKLTVEDIAAMSAVRFTWKDKRDEKVHVGTIAQDWQEKLPEVVSEDKEGYLSMDYASTALVSTIITAREVTEHEKRIQSMQDENAQLRKEIEELKELIKSKL